MMQQQVAEQEQYVNQQQVAQPVMLCPIQYVYETPMLVPPPQEQQIPQNQTFVFNVQNPPPWIQNRSQNQNQVVYIQQVPNNYQPYIQPNVMQSNLYHPQFNYQFQQQLLPQDNRQFVQIPNLTPFNTVQNQITRPVQQQIKNEDSGEKMPLLTQMLSQKANTNDGRPANINIVNNVNNAGGANGNNTGATNNNNVRPANLNNVSAPINIMRPVTQNQQVQTDISANNKGRPRNAQPQIITINPMQQHQFLPVTQKPDVLINIQRPAAPYVRPDVPQYIRSKVPSSISVKSVYKPILPRPMKHFDVMPGPQSFYYNSNYVNVPNPEMRNIVMNTDNSHAKQNINLQGERNQKPTEVTHAQASKKIFTPNNMPEVNRTIQKQSIDASVTANVKLDFVKIYDDQTSLKSNTERSTDSVTQAEEKLIRNTVYTQARGLVLNDKQNVQSRSSKRTVHDRIEEETVATNSYEDPIKCNSKYMKVESTHRTPILESNSISENNSSTPTKACRGTELLLHNLGMNSANLKRDSESHIQISDKPEVLESIQHTDLDKKNTTNTDNTHSDIEQRNVVKKDDIIKTDNSENSNCTLKVENSMLKNLKQTKVDEVKILTHVLDGYIIQESNVAFPIQKPATEKEITRETPGKETPCEQNNEKTGQTDSETDKEIATKQADLVPHLPCIYLNKNIESEGEMEYAVVNKDDPFANIQKTTVQTWTTEQLATHLEKYEWIETAAKLGEEEIDGESLLLVSKEQLLAIGVCEQHADVIAAFSSTT